jgi:hypothetical protein
MKASKFSDAQIAFVLKQAEGGVLQPARRLQHAFGQMLIARVASENVFFVRNGKPAAK